jgi:hypothetical protein
MKFIHILISALGAQAAFIPNLMLRRDILALAQRSGSPPAKVEISNGTPKFFIQRQVSGLTSCLASEARIVNFALALENLENAFYTQGLANFTDANFIAAGFPASIRGRFVQIGEHEREHVATLSAALGPNATQPCNYTLYIGLPFSWLNQAQSWFKQSRHRRQVIRSDCPAS